jgi:hypothetical protein
MKLRIEAVPVVFTLTLAACAAQKSEPKSPSADTAASQRAGDSAFGGYPGASQPASPKSEAAPPSATPSQPTTSPEYAPAPTPRPAPPGTAAGGGAASPSRAAALQGAAREVESSQRELDVAAGDCRNACRALGSMDRAAGRLCGLAQEADEQRRCDEAKQTLYSARDRVKTTCGGCPGGASVERSAPVPSLR